ncbi:MAG: 16S rRNA (adenine(1518)-N(6)/adenine(1519)-N(6))-dimethyltransferase RsmA [Cyclobacteriaceae bacterium]
MITFGRMGSVKAKKHLGQHFLKDEGIAFDITNALDSAENQNVLEIGPGTGVLTKYLIERDINLKAIEFDRESVKFLQKNYPLLSGNLISGDFLHYPVKEIFDDAFSVIGNFPYNISSQIFFKILDHQDQVKEVVCMLQREVANRIVSPPGSREYGILSVLLQVYYDMEKLFDVSPEVFDPPPKVWSSVIKLKRNNSEGVKCDPKAFKRVVKMGFQMRRKTLRNALKGLNLPASITNLEVFNKRAEQLSVSDFENLTQLIESHE